MTKYNTVPTNRSDDMGNIVTEMVTWVTSAVFGELELITREINILIHIHIPIHTCIRMMMHVHTNILHNWIIKLRICIVLYRQYMHEVFHSFPPTSPSSAPIWWGAISCSE